MPSWCQRTPSAGPAVPDRVSFRVGSQAQPGPAGVVAPLLVQPAPCWRAAVREATDENGETWLRGQQSTFLQSFVVQMMLTAFLLLCRVSLVLLARSDPRALPACRCVSGSGAWFPAVPGRAGRRDGPGRWASVCGGRMTGKSHETAGTEDRSWGRDDSPEFMCSLTQHQGSRQQKQGRGFAGPRFRVGGGKGRGTPSLGISGKLDSPR